MILMAVLLSGMSPVNASTPGPVEQMLINKGVKIISKYESSVPGLTAILAQSPSGQKQLFYTDPAEKYLIAGQVFDSTGNSMTEQDLTRVAAQESPITSDVKTLHKLYETASQLSYIQDGSAGKIVYVIFDPMCPYCHEFYINTRRAVVNGVLQIRWLPVALLGDRKQTAKIISELYSSPDIADSMSKMAYSQLPNPSTEASPGSVKMQSQNMLLLRDLSSRRVPTVLFKDSSGNVIVYDGLNDARMKSVLSAESH